MSATEKKKYAEQWIKSSASIYDNNDYDWMCSFVKPFHTVLEIGCGTGHSTLSLLEHGHKVIAIEKNEYCISKAKTLIAQSKYVLGGLESNSNNDVSFALIDVFDNDFSKILSDVSFDIVICWNVGTYWSRQMLDYYVGHMVNYGLTTEQISENPESSYGELIQWKSCKIAGENHTPVHFIDRSGYPITKKNDTYFVTLKDEIEYKKILYSSRNATVKSIGGRVLTINQQVCTDQEVELFFLSILIAP